MERTYGSYNWTRELPAVMSTKLMGMPPNDRRLEIGLDEGFRKLERRIDIGQLNITLA